MTEAFTVRECLRGYTNQALGEICARWELAARAKDSRIRAIEKVLCDPLHLERALTDLSPSCVRLLHVIAHKGATGLADLFSVPGLYVNGEAAQTAIEELLRSALLLVQPQDRAGAFCFSQIHAGDLADAPGAMCFVTEAVRACLPDFPARSFEFKQADAEVTTVPQDVQAERATSYFLETLRILEILRPRVTAGGTIHKTDESKAREMAKEAGLSTEAWHLCLMMARRLGCAIPHEGRLQTTEGANRWAESSRADRLRELFQAYTTAEDLPDVKLFFPEHFAAMAEHLPEGTLRRTYHKALAAEILRRQEMGVWYRVAGLADAIHQADPNVFFLNERWRALRSNVRDMNGPWRQRSWQAHEKRFFAWYVKSLLASVGMVELANEETLFRLTPQGLYALGVGDAPQEGEHGREDALVVQPDFEIIAYGDRCPPELRRKLDLFCERVRGGMASTYRLTQESVYRGVTSGLSMKKFLALLAQASRRELPANVCEQCRSWERKLHAISIRKECRLLECRDAAHADALAGELQGSRRVGERFLLLDKDAPEEATAIEYGGPLRPTLEQDEGLRLSARWEDENLFLRRQLDELSCPVQGANGDLTVELSREKAARQEDWGLLVAHLEALVKEPLEARYRLALRAWAGDVESARSCTATLVRFDEAEICDAVLQLEQVPVLVEGRLGLCTLVVRQGCLVKLKRVLKEEGIRVIKGVGIADKEPPEQWVSQWLEDRQAKDESEGPTKSEAAQSQERQPGDAVALPSYPPRIIREILEDAIVRRRPVLLGYQSTWSPYPSLRRVNPVTLDLSGPAPSVSGFCHDRGGARGFRLSRITGIRVLEDETF